MTSVRSRLSLVLVLVLLIPMGAVVAVVGFLAPSQLRVSAGDSMAQAAALTSARLVERCRSLGESARVLALQAASADLTAALRDGTARQQRSFAAVIRNGSVAASTGELPRGMSTAQLLAVGCSQRHGPVTAPTPAPPPPVLAEVAPVTDGSGATVGSSVVGQVFDAQRIQRLLANSSADRGVALALACPGGRGVSSAGDSATDLALRRAAFEGASRSRVGALQVATAPPRSGQPCAVAVAVRPVQSPITTAGVGVLLAVGLLAALALVLQLAAKVTSPILALTEAAERAARGDLSTRLPARGISELDRLSGAFNHMTSELQAKLDEVERSRNLLRENVARLGDTLQRTHDLDGLLMTVLGAAASVTTARRATVWLLEGATMVARVSFPANAPRSAIRRLPVGADLAGEVVADGIVRRLGHGHSDSTTMLGGPAMAAPLRRGASVSGVIVVEREAQQPPFDSGDEAMLVSLAGPAGIAVENVLLHREAQRQSVTDPLTGAGNLRHMSTVLAREVERANRFNRPLAALMLDVDLFKNINDTHGHTVGDAVLREVARRLAAAVREVDVVARYGGEEFVVVCPETDMTGAHRLGDRICEAVRATPVTVDDVLVEVTVSVGIAALPRDATTGGDLIRAADEALYAAKRSGRDRCELAPGGVVAPDADVIADR